MARPYDLFLRFLITQGVDSLQSINERLNSHHLPSVSDAEFCQHYDDLHQRLPGTIWSQITKKSPQGDFLKWMDPLGLKPLWEGEPRFKKRDLKLCYGILVDPKLRLTINGLLTKGVPHEDICKTVNPRFSCMLKPDDLAVYENAFWNPRRMARQDWRNLLEAVGPRERNILFSALTESLDDLKALLELPAKTNVSDALQYLLSQAYRKAKHYLNVNAPNADAEARAWIKETVNLADKYEKYRSGDIMDFGKELQMEFEYIGSDFPTPDEQVMQEVATKNKPKAPKSESGLEKNEEVSGA